MGSLRGRTGRGNLQGNNLRYKIETGLYCKVGIWNWTSSSSRALDHKELKGTVNIAYWLFPPICYCICIVCPWSLTCSSCLCPTGHAPDRHWVGIHEHKPWGFHWLCQVSANTLYLLPSWPPPLLPNCFRRWADASLSTSFDEGWWNKAFDTGC